MKAKSIHGQSVAVNVRLSAEVYEALLSIMKRLGLTKTEAVEYSIQVTDADLCRKTDSQ